MYGRIAYDLDGKPICEICGLSFKRLMTHVRQKHDMSAVEYKKFYGLDLHTGICSPDSAAIAREHALNNYDKVIAENLLKGGNRTRFTNGHDGRTKEKVSAQTKARLKKRLTTAPMKEAMRKSGIKLAKSGLGNKARWGDKQ
jgi:hypothetical protein